MCIRDSLQVAVEGDEQVDQFALGEAGIQQRRQRLAQMLGIPDGPIGVSAVGLDVGLMVGLALSLIHI